MIAINPQEIIDSMNKCLRAMQQGNVQYKTLGLKKMKAEHDYRIALQKEIARLKIEGTKVTLIPDLARGNEEVARLRLERDTADVSYETCRNSLRYYEKELETLRSQLAWLKSELNKTF